MSQACRSRSARLTRINTSNKSGLSDPNRVYGALPLRQINAEIQLKALELQVRAAQSLDDRVTALADYAITALLSGMFWQRSADGTPLSHFIFDDPYIAVLVGKRVFAACLIIDDLEETIRVQMGTMLADHWRVITAAGIQPDSKETVTISPLAKEISVTGSAANS